MQEPILWTSPSPLWTSAAGAADLQVRRTILQQPALLRFASDTFMDEFLALLENEPTRLGEFVAQPETWRGALAAPPPTKTPPLFARTLHRLGRLARQKSGASSLLATSGGNSLPASVTGGEVSSLTGQLQTLKLYQPGHQRYYLLTACLVCGRAGLPDRAINTGQQERTSFVVRRFLPPGDPDNKTDLPVFDPLVWEEYAFVTGPGGTGWQKVPKTNAEPVLMPNEEQLPLFAVNFTEDDGRKRRLLAGLVPVGKKEAYMGAPRRQGENEPPPPGPPPKTVDPRMMLVWLHVTEPWKRLLENAQSRGVMQRTKLPLDPSSPSKDEPMSHDLTALASSVKASREQIQTVSWYVLLDFAKFIEQYMANVWQQLIGQTPQPSLSADQLALVQALTSTILDAGLSVALQNDVPSVPSGTHIVGSLKDALLAVRGRSLADSRSADTIENGLERVAQSYDRTAPAADWPTFLFPLADSVLPAPLPPAPQGVSDDPTKLPDQLARIDHLAELIEKALPSQTTAVVPANPLAAQPVLDTRDGWFVLRCVFERPLCGPLDPPIVSEPTAPFQFAGFFDPDAPARPIRIALPVDTSPAGLRKFDKNTAFMISDMLCGQIDRIKALSLGDLVRSVLPWPLHKDLSVPDKGPCTAPSDPSLQVGMICSFSIPIITICALLLLMIIVSLLDIIFRWIPYFFICFPLPGFRAKKSG